MSYIQPLTNTLKHIHKHKHRIFVKKTNSFCLTEPDPFITDDNIINNIDLYRHDFKIFSLINY